MAVEPVMSQQGSSEPAGSAEVAAAAVSQAAKPQPPKTWIARHSVEVTVMATVLVLGAVLRWFWDGDRAPAAATASTVAAVPSSRALQPSLSGSSAQSWQAPPAPHVGAVAVIDAGKISADILNALLKNPGYQPVVAKLGLFVGQAIKAQAHALSARGWVVLASSDVLAAPRSRDFTAVVEQAVLAQTAQQAQHLLAQSPAPAPAPQTPLATSPVAPVGPSAGQASAKAFEP